MAGFTDEQLKAIEWHKGPLLILGTPGSGKTTVIVNRINNLIYGYGVRPSSILVITFTRAAAKSMKDRFLDISGLESTDVRFGTFHSFFYWIIRTAYKNSDIKVLDEDEKRNILRKILQGMNIEDYDNEDTLNSVINQLGRISCDMISIDDYYSSDMADKDFRMLYHKYTDYKKTENFLDFDDMVTECYKLLHERQDILQQIRHIYPYIMVDEFQDTNRIQYEILKMLAHPDDNLFVVGDDDQSIYGFRGARPDIMLSFSKEFPDSKTLRLSYNHRCPKEIVEASSSLIAFNKKRYDKNLISSSSVEGHIEINHTKDIREENELIVKRINKAIKSGTEPKDIAVLYRTNLGPRRLMYKLREYGIDFNLKDNMPDIFSHPVIVPIVNYIYYALGNHSRSMFLSFMNKPVRYISRDMIKGSTVELDELMIEAGDKQYLRDNIRRLKNEMRTIASLSPYAAVNYIREAVGYNTYLKKLSEERNTSYDEMCDVLDEFQSMTKDTETFGDFYDMISDYRAMLKRQSEISSENENTDLNVVQLMTLHSAKGLEFSIVHILDVLDGVIPHKRSKAMAELEEERRMLYVGMTRSSKELYLYVPDGSGEESAPASRFIKEIYHDA